MKKLSTLILAVVLGLTAVFISIELLGTTSSVLAQEQALAEPLNTAPAQGQSIGPKVTVLIVLTDTDLIEIQGLSGNVLGEGTHAGQIKCNGNRCNKGTEIRAGDYVTDPLVYSASTRQFLDPVERVVVVAGKGTIAGKGQKERFSFTATFTDNGDGTIWVRYEASRPDASFIIPKSPGTFEITGKP